MKTTLLAEHTSDILTKNLRQMQNMQLQTDTTAEVLVRIKPQVFIQLFHTD